MFIPERGSEEVAWTFLGRASFALSMTGGTKNRVGPFVSGYAWWGVGPYRTRVWGRWVYIHADVISVACMTRGPTGSLGSHDSGPVGVGSESPALLRADQPQRQRMEAPGPWTVSLLGGAVGSALSVSTSS